MNDLAREASLSPGLMCHPGVGGVADKENTIDCGWDECISKLGAGQELVSLYRLYM